MFVLKLGVIFCLYLSTFAEDNKWVWNDNNRNKNERSGGLRFEKSGDDNARYNVYENDYDDNRPNRPFGLINNRPPYNRPELNGDRPYNRPPYPRPELNGDRPYPIGAGSINRPGGERPLQPGPGPIYNRPGYPGTGFIGPNRPGGVYGNGEYPNIGYGQGGRPQYYPGDDRDPGVLTGPIPSWVKEGPFKNFDTCKCTEQFNCRTPGLSYGHCDVGKKYCCYNRNKIEDLGSDYPSRPIHSPENGILVGPGGPVDRPHRPGRPNRRPGLINRPIGYGDQNGILVGPGGRPYDRRRDI